MRLSTNDIVTIVTQEINQSQGFDSDVLASKRQTALEYYQGIMPAAPEGRSQIVSTDVADAIHALLAQLQPLVKTTQIEFEPLGDGDEPQAQAESDYVRQAIERAGGYTAVFNAIHDALLIGNGWIKVYVDEDDKITTDDFPPDLPDEVLFLLSQPTAPNQKVDITVSDTKTRVKRTTTKRKLDFDSIPPEDMLFSNNVNGDMDDIRFVAQRKLYTVSELIEDGVSKDIAESLPDASTSFYGPSGARLGPYNEGIEEAIQTAEKLKEVYCCYIRLDMTGSGKSELRYVWVSGQELLKNKPAEYIPYLTGSAIPMPHRVQGIGIFEKLGAVQAGKTHILRQYMDNLALANQSRIGAVEGQVNMSDLTNGRVNGIVRLRSPDALVPLPNSDIGPQAMAGLGYLDQVRVQRVGASLDFNEVQSQLMSSSATAAAGQLANIEKMSGWFASNLIETLLKPAFLLVHRVLRTDLGGPVMFKVGDKWTQTDTSQWPERENTNILMGLTSLEKAQRVNALGTLIQQQQLIIEKGGLDILTSLSKAHNSMSDWIRANDLGDPADYLIDPDSEEGQQGKQHSQMLEQQQKQEMMDMQQQLLQIQHQFELLKQKNDIEQKKWEEMMKAEQVEADLTTKLIIADKKGTVDVQTTGMDNQVDLIEGVVKGQNQK